ncbi:MAG: DUF1294 domain-containing protein [Thaumarchaeota archaeon]|nr:DUF1294 domain-containing protein [Nitrososphaerota archaeon]
MSPIEILSVNSILLWFLVMGAVGFAGMGIDKALAKSNWGDRISERSLWAAALIGGFLGIVAGALAFHHKTSKASFWPPVVLAVTLWALVLFFVRGGGAL